MNFKTAKMMTKYRVCMTFMSILLLLFHFVFLFSCGKLPEKTFAFSDNLRIDSLEHMAMDSIYRNPRYAHSALDEALSLTKDSDKYYKLLAAKSQIYFANSVYDSGFVLHRSIIDYCDRVPMSPKIHGLLGTLKIRLAIIIHFWIKRIRPSFAIPRRIKRSGRVRWSIKFRIFISI